MAKNKKLLRYRYEEAQEGKPYSEGFTFEKSDNGGESWDFISKYPCHRSAAFPDEESADYIHCGALRTIVDWVALGYNFDR